MKKESEKRANYNNLKHTYDMKHIQRFENFLNEAKQVKFEVGKKYKHDKFGEFEVIELMSGQHTKVQFKKEPKGETSIIAGWGSDGYPEV